MVKDHSDIERRNPLPPQALLFPFSSNGYFISTYSGLCYTSHRAPSSSTGVMGSWICLRIQIMCKKCCHYSMDSSFSDSGMCYPACGIVHMKSLFATDQKVYPHVVAAAGFFPHLLIVRRHSHRIFHFLKKL